MHNKSLVIYLDNIIPSYWASLHDQHKPQKRDQPHQDDQGIQTARLDGQRSRRDLRVLYVWLTRSTLPLACGLLAQII